MPLLNKTKMVRERISEYNTQVLECMDMYKKAFEDYIGEMGRESLEEGYRNVHGADQNHGPSLTDEAAVAKRPLRKRGRRYSDCADFDEVSCRSFRYTTRRLRIG